MLPASLHRLVLATQKLDGITGRGTATIRRAMADERELSLQEQLEEIGAQLDWVRGYL